MAGVRRTWDKDAYEVKAKERLENEGSGEPLPGPAEKRKRTGDMKEEFRRADQGFRC